MEKGGQMKINWCRILGHKWVPLVVGFELNGYTFITCYCGRCGMVEKKYID